ncbi:MAG: HD domain-containing protein [Wenzhouxiangella sp.]
MVSQASTPVWTVAQTNLQLYAQLLQAGFSDDALEAVNRAYLFAARNTAKVLRGSGKPFACHLVGTASLLAEAGQGWEVITAALLHAMYQNRVPFPGADNLDQRRHYLRQQFGDAVESLVHDYHHFEVVRLDQFSDEQLREKRTVVMMRLADEMEDLLDHGVAMHGQPGDDETVGGSAASRRAQKANLATDLLRAARIIDATSLERHLEYWLAETASPRWPECLRSGEYSSFNA